MSYRFIEKLSSRSICSCSTAVYKLVWHIPLLSVQWINSWWWTDELSETCRVSWQNKFVKLVHPVGFITKKFVTMHGHTDVKDLKFVYCSVCRTYSKCFKAARHFQGRHTFHNSNTALHCNANFNTCAIREALQNDPVKSRHVGPFVRTDRTASVCCVTFTTVWHSGAQIPGRRSRGRRNFARWRLTSVAPHYRPCFLSPFWRLEFWGVS